MNRLYWMLLLWVFLPLSVFSQRTDVSELKNVLKQLDKEVTDRYKYQDDKETKIKELQLLLKVSKTDEDRWRVLGDLLEAHSSYQLDSAMAYALERTELAKQLGDSSKIVTADIALSGLLIQLGNYIDAYEIIQRYRSEDTPELDNVLWSLYSQQHQGSRSDTLKNKYRTLMYGVTVDLVNHCDARTHPMDYYTSLADLYILEKKYDEAKKLMLENYKRMQMSPREEAIYYNILARTCGEETTNEKTFYYALSALADIRSCVKQYTSLIHLAQHIYESGDVERAYLYIKTAMEDASFSGSKECLLDVSKLFPIVNDNYQLWKERQQQYLMFYLVLSVVLAVLLLVGIYYLHKFNRKLRDRNQILDDLNKKQIKLYEEQKKLSQELNEANVVKETYILQYIEFCLEVIDKSDQQLKGMFRLLQEKKYDVLYKHFSSSLYEQATLKTFYRHFDKNFLALYPTFVEEYNQLLRPEGRLELKNPESLNTELRVYALVRFGITDSVKIANFLHLSLSTVYNKRTKARNSALGDRESFEYKVSQIGKIHYPDPQKTLPVDGEETDVNA